MTVRLGKDAFLTPGIVTLRLRLVFGACRFGAFDTRKLDEFWTCVSPVP